MDLAIRVQILDPEPFRDRLIGRIPDSESGGQSSNLCLGAKFCPRSLADSGARFLNETYAGSNPAGDAGSYANWPCG